MLVGAKPAAQDGGVENLREEAEVYAIDQAPIDGSVKEQLWPVRGLRGGVLELGRRRTDWIAG